MSHDHDPDFTNPKHNGQTMNGQPQFRFKGRATGSDPSGYYYPRWDHAQKVSVVATTKDEANNKAWAMLGRHPRHGSFRSTGWAIIWDKIDEEPCQ